MKSIYIIAGVAVLGLVGGFAWLAAMDVPVAEKQIVKTIPNETFYDRDKAAP